VIAHGLCTIRDTDRIIVLTEEGIVEQGKHDDLIYKEKGIYNRLYFTQFGNNAIAE